jgi:hypothetical protein
MAGAPSSSSSSVSEKGTKTETAGPKLEVNIPAAATAAAGAASSSTPEPLSPVEDPEDEIRRREESPEARAEREEIQRTQSHATDASVLTRTTTGASSALPRAKKPWYKEPNPLKWGSIPPMPKERGPSREYSAGFFSRLTFQWMAPLMEVIMSRLLFRDVFYVFYAFQVTFVCVRMYSNDMNRLDSKEIWR